MYLYSAGRYGADLPGVCVSGLQGEPPITKEDGASLKILAQTSNYTNVDIASAEIVETVIANAGITVDWQLVDDNNHADSVGSMLTTGAVDADIVLLPDQDPNQTYIKSGMFVALDNYFSVMPNFSKWLDVNPVIKAELTAEDGHIYYVPIEGMDALKLQEVLTVKQNQYSRYYEALNK